MPMDGRSPFSLGIPVCMFTLYLLVRPFSSFIISYSGDEIRIWEFCRLILLGLPQELITHNIVRFGMTFPAMIAQMAFGSWYAVYYIAPLSFALIAVVFFYNLMRRWNKVGNSVVLTGIFLVSPPFFLSSINLQPEIFSIGYLACALWLLLRYTETERNAYLIFSAVLFFLSYTAKITNLFFVFGILVVAFFIIPKRSLALFAGVLLAGYAVEHALIYLAYGEPLGRLGFIINIHGQTMDRIPVAVFSEETQSPWNAALAMIKSKILSFGFLYRSWIILCFPLAAYSIIQKRAFFKLLGGGLAAFVLFTIFGVKSINPLVPFEPALTRYLFAGIFFSMVLIGSLYGELFTNIFKRSSYYAAMGLIFLMAFWIAFGSTVSRLYYTRIDYLADLYFMEKVHGTIPVELYSGAWVQVPHKDWEYNKFYRWVVTFFLDDQQFMRRNVEYFNGSTLNTKMNESDFIHVTGSTHNGRIIALDPASRTLEMQPKVE
jgi:hypothetical protein